MKSALVTGVSGQDGVYLSRLLLGKGYKVYGAVRDEDAAKMSMLAEFRDRIELIRWDMMDQGRMLAVLRACQPAEVYNLAAYSSGAGMFDDPVQIAEVNGVAVARLLEAIRGVDPGIRFCQASSREIFGEAGESPQTEATPVNPRSPYGAAKLFADCMIRIYRSRYGLHACSAILYNHESPLRSLGFVTRKITHEAVRIKLGFVKTMHLGNLDALRDWGFAGDTVRAMWLMLQQKKPDDYVVATGEAHSVREFCELAFSRLGLDYREYVRVDPSVFRPLEPVQLVGSAAKATHELGWAPEVGFRDLVHMMVDADLKKFE